MRNRRAHVRARLGGAKNQNQRNSMLRKTLALLPAAALAASLLPATAEAAPTHVSKMSQGTNLKAEPSLFRAPANPLCSPAGRRAMKAFRTNGGDTISLVVPLIQTSIRSSVITRRADTPSDACLAQAIRNGRAEGLKVNVKMLLEFREPVVVPLKGGGSFESLWRGRVDPIDKGEWFDQWGYWSRHYAVIARQQKARGVTIGTEMVALTKGKANQKRWSGIVRDLHKRAPGVRVAYAMNRTGESLGKFGKAVDDLGVTLYFKLDVEGEVTETKLLAGMRPYRRSLRRTADKYDRRIVVDEVGARSRLGTHANTSDGTKGGQVSMSEQRMLYGAFFKFLDGEREVKGVSTWLSNVDPRLMGPKDSGYTVQGKDAEAVQAKWFGGKVPR